LAKSKSYEDPHNAVSSNVISSLFSPNILLRTLFSYTLKSYVPLLMPEAKFYTHTKLQENYSFAYFNFYTYGE
jgi:hypothetical protein